MLIADEPTGNLDPELSLEIMELLTRFNEVGVTLLVATHDLEQAGRWDSVLCLNGRQIAVGPPATTLDRWVLEATYGGAIVEIPGGGGRAVLPPHHHPRH